MSFENSLAQANGMSYGLFRRVLCIDFFELIHGHMDARLVTLTRHLACMNSAVDADRDASHKFLSEFFEKAPFEFAALLARVVMQDDVPLTVIHAALICIGRSLTSSSETQIAQIRATFQNPANAESRALIRQAVFRGIMFDMPAIRLIGAHCLDLLVQIEQGEWIDVFSSLNIAASSSTYEDHVHQGAICAFREILQSGHVPTESIIDQLQSLFVLVDGVLSRPSQYSPGMHKECCLLFPVLLQRMVAQQNTEQVVRDLHLIELNIKHDDFEIFKAMLASVSHIFKGKYCEMTQKLLDTILHLCASGFRSKLISFQVATLVLWGGMAKYELKLASRYESFKNHGGVECPEPLGVIEKCVNTLFPILCGFMGLLAPDMDLSDIDYSDPPFVAVDCLSNVYAVAHRSVVGKIEEMWRARSDEKPAAHAVSVLCLVAMLESDARNKPETTHFLTVHISDVLMYCASPTSLSYFCFQIMAKAISRYHIGMEYVNDGRVLKCVIEVGNRAIPVVEKSLSVINSICEISAQDDEESPLARFIGQIMGFLGQVMEHPNLELRSKGVTSLAFVVSFLPNSKCSNDQDGLCNQALTNAEVAISRIRESGMINSPDVFPVLVAYCDVLSAIGNRLGAGVATLSDRIMELVFNLLHAQRSLYEESTTVMSSMVLALGEQSSRYYGTMRPLLQTMLNSGNAQVATSAMRVLSDIFASMPRGIVSDIPPILEQLFKLVESPMTDGQLMVRVVGTAADAMSVPDSDAVVAFLPRLFDATGKILTNVTAESAERMKESFGALLSALVAVVKYSTDEVFLAANLNNFFTAIDKFTANGVFCRETLLPFFQLLEEMARKYGSKISIKLNRRNITETLRRAKTMDDPLVADRAAKMIDFLKYYK